MKARTAVSLVVFFAACDPARRVESDPGGSPPDECVVTGDAELAPKRRSPDREERSAKPAATALSGIGAFEPFRTNPVWAAAVQASADEAPAPLAILAAVDDPIIVTSPPFGASCDGETDDTSAIQAALDAAHDGGGGHVLVPASTVTSSALVISSDTWLEVAADATVTFRAGSSGPMLQNRAVADAHRTVADASIPASSRTLRSPTAGFTSSDVGRSVVIPGAGPGPGGVYARTVAPLVATIVSVTDGATATLSREASVGVDAATCAIYERDRNIQVSGGTWARGSAGGSDPYGLHTMVFRRLDGLSVSDLAITSTGDVDRIDKYALAPGDVSDVSVERLACRGPAACVQFIGPASNLQVRAVDGSTWDDLVAFVARDYDGYADVVGDIERVIVEGVTGSSQQALVKLLGGTGTRVRDVTLRNLGGVARYAAVAAVDDGTGPSDIGGLLVDTVSTKLAEYGAEVVLSASAGKDAAVRNIQGRTATAGRPMVTLGTWDSVIVEGVEAGTTQAARGVTVVSVSGTVDDLQVRGVQVSGSAHRIAFVGIGSRVRRIAILDSRLAATPDGAGGVLEVLGSVGEYLLSNVTIENGADLLLLGPRSVAPTGQLVNCSTRATGRLAYIESSTDLTLVNVIIDAPLAPPVRIDGATHLVLRGACVEWRDVPASWHVEAGGTWTGSVRVVNPYFRTDVSLPWLQRNRGDTAFNSNSALACGSGRVVSDGVQWRNVHSGASCL